MYPQMSWYSGTHRDSTHQFINGILTDKTSEWSCTIKTIPGNEREVIDVTA